MSSDTLVFGSLAGVVLLGVAFYMWKLWGDHQADVVYAQVKSQADADVHHALEGKRFIVGTPSDFIDGKLRGHFGWLSAQGAWGLRIEDSTSSLRSLEGRQVALWVRADGGRPWVRHTDSNVRLKAFNTDISFVLPNGLTEGSQVRLGDHADDRVAS
jgi:hypothetical protein